MLTTPSNPTILIVDDSETDRYTYRRYLEPLDKLGYRILDCESAEQALDLCDRDRPQLILLDYLLHDMDGLEFLRQLANRMETLPPTIMLTGEGSELVAVEAMKLGVKDYLVKRQLTAQNLVNLVTNILLQQKLEDQYDRRYNALFYAIDQGFCRCEMIFDACGKGVDYRFLEINHLFEQMTGLANAEGKTIKELVPDLDEIWFETYGAVVTTGKSIRLESEVVAMDRWFDINAFPIELSQGHGFGVLFTNISDRKRQELNTNFLVAIQKDLVVLEDPDPQLL
jgi:CheY-like chemotaxis protein